MIEAWIQPFANPFWVMGEQMDIPAHSTNHKEQFSYTFQDGGTIFSANLHMHTMGRSGRFTLIPTKRLHTVRAQMRSIATLLRDWACGPRLRRRSGSGRRPAIAAQLRCETLEGRWLLATVSW